MIDRLNNVGELWAESETASGHYHVADRVGDLLAKKETPRYVGLGVQDSP